MHPNKYFKTISYLDIFFTCESGRYFINILVSKDISIKRKDLEHNINCLTPDSIGDVVEVKNLSNKVHLKKTVETSDLFLFLTNDIRKV